MAYGIIVQNQNSETVIDDTYTTLFLDNSVTSSGVVFPPPSGVSQPTAYKYLIDTSKIQFVNLAVGDFFVKSNWDGYFYSNKSSLQFRNGILSSDLPEPTFYGVAVYNSSGDLCYTAGADLIPVQETVILPQDLTLTNSSASWVCICETPVRFIDAGFIKAIFASGVKRSYSTQYEYYSIVTSTSGPPVTYNSGTPSIFLSA